MENLISIKNLLKNSFEIYVNKFWFFIKLISLNILIFLLLVPSVVLIFFTNENFWTITFTYVFFALSLTCVILLYTLINISLIISIKERATDLTIKQVLLKGVGIFISYLWVSFLSGLAILGGLILFIIPGIIFSIWFAFSSYILISEGKKGRQALSESKELTKGYWWAIFGRFALSTLLIAIISWSPLVGDIVSIFFGVPFGTIYAYLMYEDLKRIKSASNQPI